jgi:hypothetical protein
VSNQTTLPGDVNLPAGRRPVAFEVFVPVYDVEHPTPAERRSRFLGRDRCVADPAPAEPALR